jgi:serine/threonine protein kinase
MELCEKGDLDHHMRVTRNITCAQKLKWAVQIAGGLDFLHANGVIHCDLKPANILLDSDYNAKIIDFGISKQQMQHTKMTFKIGVSLRYSPYELVVE